MRLHQVMQREDNYLQESYNQSRSDGVPVSMQEERYSRTPDQYASEPSSTTASMQQRARNQLYPSQQSMIKMEPNVSRQDVVQSPDSLTGNVYSDNIESYPNEGRSYSQQDSMARSQPQSVEMYKSQAVQPLQSVISSTQSNLQSTNLFYENAINKDSELKLSMKDRQALMNEGNSSNDLNMGIVSSEEVVSTEGGNSARGRLDLNLGQSDAPDLANRPISSDKTHVCMTCFKAFKNKPQLTQHELVHNGIRKHTCSYCDKSFKQLCHLNQHIRTHTGERPYKCIMEGCGRSFAQLSNLHHHQKNHEEHVKRDISRQYRCVICDRSYANESSLRTHTLKLHVNLNKVDTGSLMNTGITKKRKRKQVSDPELLANSVIEIVDDDGPPPQIRVGLNLSQSIQIPASSVNQSSLSQSANIVATSPQDSVIHGILQKRMLTPEEELLIERCTASRQLHTSQFQISDSHSRQDQNSAGPLPSITKAPELARPIPVSVQQQQDRAVFSRESFNQDRLPQQQSLQQKGAYL